MQTPRRNIQRKVYMNVTQIEIKQGIHYHRNVCGPNFDIKVIKKKECEYNFV